MVSDEGNYVSFSTREAIVKQGEGDYVPFSAFKSPNCPVSYDGAGTADNPYLVDSVDKLLCIDYGDDNSYKLTKNIDMSGYATKSINFKGTLDGNGYTLRNLEFTWIAFNNGVIKNLSFRNSRSVPIYLNFDTVRNTSISESDIQTTGRWTEDKASSLVAENKENALVEECYAEDVVLDDPTKSDTIYIGGLVGINNSGSEISNCYVNGADVTANTNVGGLVGYNSNSSINNVYTANITNTSVTTDNSGAIAGLHNSSTVTDTYYDTDTTFTGDTKGKALTTTQLTGSNAESNTDFNYSSIWNTTESYPKLRQSSVATTQYEDMKVNYKFNIKASNNVLGQFETLLYENLRNSSNDNIATIKIGTDGSSNTENMVALGNAISSLNLDLTRSFNSITILALFLEEDTKGTTGEIKEVGLFDSSGNLVYRQVIEGLETGRKYELSNSINFN